jgi:hypothetical protein
VLWLRLRGAHQVFCAPCEVEVMDLPAPRNIVSRPRLHDVERGLQKLDPFANRLIAMIALQDYTHNEAARLRGCRRRSV